MTGDDNAFFALLDHCNRISADQLGRRRTHRIEQVAHPLECVIDQVRDHFGIGVELKHVERYAA